MTVKNKIPWMGVLFLGICVVLSCTLTGSPQENQPDSSAIQTGIAVGLMATNVANQQMTLQALQVEMTIQVIQATMQAGNMPPAQITQPPPTQNIQPPTQNIPPTPTDVPPPAELILRIWYSVETFYCYQPPYTLTITVQVSDINRGMAVYYHIRDKSTGVASTGQVIDLHRKTSDTRSATIIGGGSNQQNLQFPPLMGESYFVYQIISDDGLYRTPTYSNITFFPCGQ